MWTSWRKDPATTQYGPAEIALAIQLAWLFEAYVRGEEKHSEVRLIMDSLGLTPKGKRDLRWRIPQAAEVVEIDAEREKRASARRRKIRAVEPAQA